MELSAALAVVLKEKRKVKNISQEELAFRAGLDRTYISLLERKLRKPTLDVIFRVCNVLEIKPNKFIEEVEQQMDQKEV